MDSFKPKSIHSFARFSLFLNITSSNLTFFNSVATCRRLAWRGLRRTRPRHPTWPRANVRRPARRQERAPSGLLRARGGRSLRCSLDEHGLQLPLKARAWIDRHSPLTTPLQVCEISWHRAGSQAGHRRAAPARHIACAECAPPHSHW